MVHVREDRVPQSPLWVDGVQGAQTLGGQHQAGSILRKLGQDRLVVGRRQRMELVDQQGYVPALVRWERRLLAERYCNQVDQGPAQHGRDIGANLLFCHIHYHDRSFTHPCLRINGRT